MRQILDIAIAGAGVGGLASAIALSRLGHTVTVFERFAQSRPLGSGLMIQPTGLAALAVLGLRDELAPLGARLGRLYGDTGAGETIFDVAYGDLEPGLHALGVHRAALHGVLWRGFERSGAAFEGGEPVADIVALSGGKVELTGAGGRRLGRFDLALDASGARSTLRALVDPRPPRTFEYGAVWATVSPAALPGDALTQRYHRASVMIGHLPVGPVIPGGAPKAAFFWSLKAGDLPAWREGFGRWREEVCALWPVMTPVVEGLASPEDLTPAHYCHFTARQPFAGRVALIGDSAHATSPQLGQGANTALLDACALAAALEGARTLEDALADYAAARSSHVRFYQWASQLMTPFFQSDSRLLPFARDLVFNRLKIVPWLRREMVRTLAGLKTGPLTHASPARLASADRLALTGPPET